MRDTEKLESEIRRYARFHRFMPIKKVAERFNLTIREACLLLSESGVRRQEVNKILRLEGENNRLKKVISDLKLTGEAAIARLKKMQRSMQKS